MPGASGTLAITSYTPEPNKSVVEMAALEDTWPPTRAATGVKDHPRHNTRTRHTRAHQGGHHSTTALHNSRAAPVCVASSHRLLAAGPRAARVLVMGHHGQHRLGHTVHHVGLHVQIVRDGLAAAGSVAILDHKVFGVAEGGIGGGGEEGAVQATPSLQAAATTHAMQYNCDQQPPTTTTKLAPAARK